MRPFIRFLLLLCGLTSLATLLLSNTETYLAGGVLGGWLIKSVYPSFGMFGSFMAAFIMAVIGFILSSGVSLIMLLVSAYQWLTAKYEDEKALNEEAENEIALETVASAANSTVEQLEEITLPESVLRAREAAAQRAIEQRATEQRLIVGLTQENSESAVLKLNRNRICKPNCR